MCRSCLDLVDAILRPPRRGANGGRVPCYHTPPCGYRALTPQEREQWMRDALPTTFTMLALRGSHG